MTQTHPLTLTWGAGAQTVCVAGNFNDWSATATPLHKQADGSFSADIPVPHGEKLCFKYVVDGEWKVREDEPKEWDAAGNMNNIYTASSHSDDSATPPLASAAGVGAASVTTGAGTAAASHHSNPAPSKGTTVPPSTTADAQPPTNSKMEPDTLIAAAAPGSAGGAPTLGHPVSHPAGTETSGATAAGLGIAGAKSKAPTGEAPVPYDHKGAADAAGVTKDGLPKDTLSPGPVSTAVKVPVAETVTDHSGGVTSTAPEASPKEIEEIAKTANIGEAPTGTSQGITEKAAELGAVALASLGTIIGGAAVAVEKTTGYDIVHSQPVTDGDKQLTIEEATAKGIDVDHLDAAESTTTGTQGPPPASAIMALDEKVEELKHPQGAPPPSAVAALEEKVAELKPPSAEETEGSKDATGIAAVPLPGGEPSKTSLPADGQRIEPTSPVSPTDSEKKHDIPSQTEVAALNHKSVPAPVFTTISEKDPKKDRTLAASDLNDTAGTKPVDSAPGVDPKAAKAQAESHPAGSSGTALEEADKSAAPDTPEDNLKQGNKSQVGAATEPGSAPQSSSGTPATPTKVANGNSASGAAGASAQSTPAKGTPGKEKSDAPKKKGGVFSKIKHALSPHKDKSK